MAKNRYIRDSFWTDPYIENLDPSEKLLFLYYLTNPLCNVAGIYEIRDKRVAYETGFDKDMVEKIRSRFVRDGKMLVVDDWIVLTNFAKHQASNPNMLKGMQRIIDELPDEVKALKGFERLPYFTLLNLTLPNLTSPNVNEEASEEPSVEEPVKKSVHGIPEVIKAFESVNQQAPKWYGNKTQRKACEELIEANGLENVLKVVSLLPKTNQTDYMPVIITPHQLASKWSSLGAALQRKKNNQTLIF